MHNRPIVPGRAQLERAREDLRLYRNLLALMPYTVKGDRDAETVSVHVPSPRRPVDLWPVPRRPVPQGLPPTSRIGLPRRPR